MPQALEDLDAIHAYIAANDRSAARLWIARLRKRAKAATANPRIGRIVPEIGDPAIREVFLRSYRVVYRLGETKVEVLTVQ